MVEHQPLELIVIGSSPIIPSILKVTLKMSIYTIKQKRENLINFLYEDSTLERVESSYKGGIAFCNKCTGRVIDISDDQYFRFRDIDHAFLIFNTEIIKGNLYIKML